MKNYFLRGVLIFFFFYATNSLHGQQIQEISGYVRDWEGNGLPNSNVILKKISDSTIVSFTIANKDGFFRIKIPAGLTDSLIITATHINYAKSEKVLKFGVDFKELLIFYLEKEATTLKEVIVSAKRLPFKASNDTTVYNLSSYSDGTERKLEDILKKLPGIKVSETGAITFKGKEIDKIMIEGDDFFSQNYKLLSKNVPALLIEQVEAIENYNDEYLLKGIQNSNKVVLNLKIGKQFSASLFGNIEAGVGDPKLFNLNSSVFSFLNKLKIGALTNFNNTGFDPMGNTKYTLSINPNDNKLLNQNAELTPPPIRMNIIGVPGIQLEKYNRNNSHMAAIQVSLPMGTKIKSGLYGYWYKDNSLFSLENFYNYNLPDSTFNIQEQMANNRRILNGAINWNLLYRINEKSSLRYIFSYSSELPSYYNKYQIQNPNTSELTNTIVQDNSRLYTNKFTYINRPDSNGAIILEALLSAKNTKPQNYISSNRFDDVFGIYNLSEPIVQQELNTVEKAYTLSAKWIGTKGVHSYEISMSQNWYSAQLNSGVKISDKQIIEPINDSRWKNAVHYNKSVVSFAFQDMIKLGRLGVNFKVPIRMLTAEADSNNLGSIKLRKLVADPSLNASYLLGRYSKLSIDMSLENTVSGIFDMYGGYILIDYRNVFSKTFSWNLNKVFQSNLNYSYVNSTKYFFLYLKANYTRQSNPYLSNFYSFVPNINFINSFPFIASSHITSFSGEVSKYLPFFKIRLGFEPSLMFSKSNFSIDSSLWDGTTIGTGFRAYCITGFDKWFNLSIEASVNPMKQINSIHSAPVTSSFKNSIGKSKLGIKLRPYKEITANISGEYLKWKGTDITNDAFFFDAQINFSPVKKRYSFELKGINLLNSKKILQNSLGTYVQSSTLYAINPRFLIFTFAYSF
ncbi:MAG: hypothetical protein EO766_01165 [Hydrotalea sp. AMD]|uniref:TonB-dependent receptor n=1 Tax=Hydrotalea sp. AMD TaxID=2501297 RepID=UPI00102625FD|nr:hypothetical protein [Hydrotalea sp. AMD]RWZ90798.1 MAG: hypothetical protein EO766_01165 [Hydrotalea sp. AMD]